VHVLIASYEYPPLGGGGGVFVRDLAEELAKQIEVSVLTSACDDLPRREVHGNLEILRAPVLLRHAHAVASYPSMLSYFPSSFWVGRRTLRSRRFDLVHTSFAIPSGPSGLLLARRFHLPHVLSIQGGDIYDPSKRLSPHRTPLLRQTVHWVIHGSDRVVAASRDIADRAREFYAAQAIERIPLAVKPLSVSPLSRVALGLGWKDDDVILITVGRLVARKGLAELIEIVAAQANPRLRLLIVGEGPERERLEAEVERCCVAGRVHLTGFISEEQKWQLLALSDLYVSTTLHEGFGIVFLEAMESGLPVLCYDCGGQTDFVNSEVGCLVPVGRREIFAAELRKLVTDVERRSHLAAAARTVAREYHVDRMAERYLRLYEACLSARHSR